MPGGGADRSCGNECGELASGRHAIPIGRRTCDVVANDYTGAWDPMPVCERCHTVHAKAGPAGLEAYLEATKDIRETLRAARLVLIDVAGRATNAIDELGPGDSHIA